MTALDPIYAALVARCERLEAELVQARKDLAAAHLTCAALEQHCELTLKELADTEARYNRASRAIQASLSCRTLEGARIALNSAY